MTTSHQLDDLRADADLAIPLKRALRLIQELADIAAGDSPRTDQLRLQQHLERRMQEAQLLVKTRGFSDAEAKKLVRNLLFEMQEAAPLNERAYLSVEEAIGT